MTIEPGLIITERVLDKTPLERIESVDVEACLETLAEELRAYTQDQEPVMLGIRSGGVWLAERLHRALGLSTELGTLNISFYRDDFSRIGLHPRVEPSEIPEELEGRTVILVDDVLHTGRTIRAAMNELFDYGRPAAIRLVVLVDRCEHELPIAADHLALRVDVPAGHQIKLLGPAPLRLVRK